MSEEIEVKLIASEKQVTFTITQGEDSLQIIIGPKSRKAIGKEILNLVKTAVSDAKMRSQLNEVLKAAGDILSKVIVKTEAYKGEYVVGPIHSEVMPAPRSPEDVIS